MFVERDLNQSQIKPEVIPVINTPNLTMIEPLPNWRDLLPPGGVFLEPEPIPAVDFTTLSPASPETSDSSESSFNLLDGLEAAAIFGVPLGVFAALRLRRHSPPSKTKEEPKSAVKKPEAHGGDIDLDELYRGKSSRDPALINNTQEMNKLLAEIHRDAAGGSGLDPRMYPEAGRKFGRSNNSDIIIDVRPR